MAQSMEAEKYETLQVIGRTALFMVTARNQADVWLGKGSFGIIRKVRRVADSHVNSIVWRHRLPIDMRMPDPMSQGNQLHQDGAERARTAARGIFHPQLVATPQYCCLLPSPSSQRHPRPSSVHGILWWGRPQQGDQDSDRKEPICGRGLCLEHVLPIGHCALSLPLRRGSARGRNACVWIDRRG